MPKLPLISFSVWIDFKTLPSSLISSSPRIVCVTRETMEQQPERREGRSFPERKGQKRKLEEGAAAASEDREISSTDGGGDAILNEIAAQVSVLNSAFSWQESDRAAAKRATQVLSELAKNGE